MAELWRPYHVADASGDQETDNPDRADTLGWFKVELWSRDNQRAEHLIWAGNRIDTARLKFATAVKHRPRGRYTIRQRDRVLKEWP
jgi:hypothetical protein